ncbi:MAG: hypothetical protein U0Y68_05575 [Blastocatellia bacterium]
MKSLFITFLTWLLTLALTASPAAAQSKEEKLKTKIIDWGLQKNVTVRLRSGETVVGRIAEITDDYFAVQGMNAGQVTTRNIHYNEVHRISGKGETDVRRVTQYIALGSMVLFAVLAVVKLSQTNDRPRAIVFQ